MRTIRILPLLLFLIGCATPSNLSSEYDESIDFDDYSSFVLCVEDLFVENTDFPQYDNVEVRSLIGGEVESQMIQKGYKNNVSKPELQAGFRIILSKEEVVFTNCDFQTEYKYWESCTINREIYTRETLVAYVSDIEKNQVIWQAKIDCDLNKSPNALKKHVKEIVSKVFETYPG